MSNSHAFFWEAFSKNEWEAVTFDVFDHYLKSEMTYLDIGAWIGPTVCYAAKKVSKVIAFEPDPYAFYILKENIKRNGLSNVQIFNYAVSDKNGLLRMASFGKGLGDSQTSSLSGTSGKSFYIKTKSINELSKKNEKIDFVKMDIEGGEFELIPQMEYFFTTHRPIFYVSFHSPFLKESERMQSLLHIYETLTKHFRTIRNEKMQVVGEDVFRSKNCRNTFFSLVCEP
jgi:FkbM family methyltransferase